MDFASMYPSALLSSNLCYGTCAIMNREEWLACLPAQQLTTIAYRVHGERDFENDTFGESPVFHYPPINLEKDAFAMVIKEQTEAFLPHIVKHFIDLRKHHQGQYKQTKDVYHYNA
ncbi:DNA polymerase [Trichonephila clavipes]|nr:DNA polymerase [Trichonephila clavipes]